MPIMKCTKNGKSGFKYGDSGTCYTGPGAKEKALKQMRAIKYSETHSKFKEQPSIMEEIIANLRNRINKED